MTHVMEDGIGSADSSSSLTVVSLCQQWGLG
jgi:hypothetical protein